MEEDLTGVYYFDPISFTVKKHFDLIAILRSKKSKDETKLVSFNFTKQLKVKNYDHNDFISTGDI